MSLLEVEQLRISFPAEGPSRREAVKGISFAINSGETLAVVGESGSGKSVTALSLSRLLPPPPECLVTGSIRFEGRNILQMPSNELQHVRGRGIAYIFQEPSASLNPVFSIGYQISEAVRLHNAEAANDARRVRESTLNHLREVQIEDPLRCFKAYPHELSGGMQQRVMIAMALACSPRLLVADEPTTALDVTLQQEIITLLKEIKSRRQMAVLLITHNFGIVKGIADRVLVMYRGDAVEHGSSSEVLQTPKHPYTQGLINCIPRIGFRQNRLKTLSDFGVLAKP